MKAETLKILHNQLALIKVDISDYYESLEVVSRNPGAFHATCYEDLRYKIIEFENQFIEINECIKWVNEIKI